MLCAGAGPWRARRRDGLHAGTREPAAEILELACNAARDNKKSNIRRCAPQPPLATLVKGCHVGGGGKSGSKRPVCRNRAAGRFSAPRAETLLLLPPRPSQTYTRARGHEGPRGIGSGCEIHSARVGDTAQTVLNKNIEGAQGFCPWSPSQEGARAALLASLNPPPASPHPAASCSAALRVVGADAPASTPRRNSAAGVSLESSHAFHAHATCTPCHFDSAGVPFAFQSSGSGQTSRVASPCSNRRPLSLGTVVSFWTPGKAHASKRCRTSATSPLLDVRGRLRCACNAASSSPPSEPAAESPIPSRPPDARELFPTRVSVAPSGLSPPPPCPPCVEAPGVACASGLPAAVHRQSRRAPATPRSLP
jgi:hypothetical protein